MQSSFTAASQPSGRVFRFQLVVTLMFAGKLLLPGCFQDSLTGDLSPDVKSVKLVLAGMGVL